jgi:hypothetical protein
MQWSPWHALTYRKSAEDINLAISSAIGESKESGFRHRRFARR